MHEARRGSLYAADAAKPAVVRGASGPKPETAADPTDGRAELESDRREART